MPAPQFVAAVHSHTPALHVLLDEHCALVVQVAREHSPVVVLQRYAPQIAPGLIVHCG